MKRWLEHEIQISAQHIFQIFSQTIQITQTCMKYYIKTSRYIRTQTIQQKISWISHWYSRCDDSPHAINHAETAYTNQPIPTLSSQPAHTTYFFLSKTHTCTDNLILEFSTSTLTSGQWFCMLKKHPQISSNTWNNL